MKKKTIITIVATVLGVLMVALVVGRLYTNKQAIEADKNKSAALKNIVPRVEIEPVGTISVGADLNLTGVLKANREVTVSAEATGTLTHLNIDLGKQVRKGQVIGHIEPAGQALRVEGLEIQVKQQEKEVERTRKLHAGGAATIQQLEQAELALENLKNQYAQQQSMLEDGVITAPISGMLYQKTAEAGQFIATGSPIGTLIDLSQVKATVQVPEREVYALTMGAAATISAEVYPEMTYPGTITFISPKADALHNYAVEVTLENPAKNPLKAGTFVSVGFDLQHTENALSIPRRSLSGDANDAAVYVVEAGKAVRKPITLNGSQGERLIVSSGLQTGASVITTGLINVTDGMEVEVVPSASEMTNLQTANR